MISLKNAVSQETAFVVPRFPIYYGQYGAVRFWVETKETYGQRLMTQQWDANLQKWCSPKTKGYRQLVIIKQIEEMDDYFRAGLIDIDEHVGLHHCPSSVLLNMIKDNAPYLSEAQEQIINAFYMNALAGEQARMLQEIHRG